MSAESSRAASFIESVQVGQTRRYSAPSVGDGRPEEWDSAILKTAVSGSVNVGQTGLDGDEQYNRENHGGIDKAVLAYAAAHYDRWRAELPDQDWQAGEFGENLTIVGMDETNVCIGDQYRMGDVVVEVSQPRTPCWKLCRLWEQPDLAKRVVQTGRSGWYLRVLETGTIASGETVERLERPLPDWTVDRASRLLFGLDKDRDAAEELARLPQLALSWREDLMTRRLV